MMWDEFQVVEGIPDVLKGEHSDESISQLRTVAELTIWSAVEARRPWLAVGAGPS